MVSRAVWLVAGVAALPACSLAWLCADWGMVAVPRQRDAAKYSRGCSNGKTRQRPARTHRRMTSCNEQRFYDVSLYGHTNYPLEETETTAKGNYPGSTPHSRAKHTLHLVSLPPKDDTFSLPAESLVRECWRWKDSTLGDGRDYFVPRPRALREFHSLFVGMEVSVNFGSDALSDDGVKSYLPSLEVVLKLPLKSEGRLSSVEVRMPLPQYYILNGACSDDGGHSQLSSKEHSIFSETFVVEECAALSNCARLDVILVLKTIQQPQNDVTKISCSQKSMNDVAMIAAQYAVAYHLQQQTLSQRSKSASSLERTGLASWLDLPGAIALGKRPTSPHSLKSEQCTSIYHLAQRLTSLKGSYSISTHLSLIACGLASRPNRPGRDVIFRPYSSRDAHILLQLKRTVEVVSVVGTNDATEVADKKNDGGRGRVKTLLDMALSAGKAARNEGVVPEIKKLKEYGSDGTPPLALANIVAESAIEHAVKPSVAACIARLAAMETDTVVDISQMRRRVYDIVASLESSINETNTNRHGEKLDLQKMAKRLLHEPTIQLREGELSRDQIEGVVDDIERQLFIHSFG